MKMTVCDRCGNPVNVVTIEAKKDRTLSDLMNEAYDALAKAILSKKEEDLPRVMLGEEEVDLCEECRKDLKGWIKLPPFNFSTLGRKEE